MRKFVEGALLTIALLFGGAVSAQEGDGTLVVNVEAFTSEKPLPKKVEAQLRSGGLEWGLKDRQLVFTMVGKQHIDFPISHMTRYGQSETLRLPAGEYRVTGIGLEVSAGFNVQKILNRGAFVNEDVIRLTVEPGRTTTLNIKPVMYRDAAFVVDFYLPTLMASVRNDDAATEAVSLTTRGAGSIAWPQYHGPLKFVVK